jgi:hypothetical protein
MMFRKLAAALSLLTASVASAGTAIHANEHVSISPNSQIGKHIMAHARSLEGNQDADNFNWVANYDIKFQGCHAVPSWNEEANGEEDVRVSTKRLVRFRLCPSGSCDSSKAAGCSSGYGDYVIDMNTFVMAWAEAKEQYYEWECQNAEQKSGCEYSDDRDTCMYNYYSSNNMYQCMEQEENEQFQLNDYLECGQYQNNNGNNNNNNGMAYYLGPYCGMQGGSIFMGLFTDDTCTEFADDNGGLTTFASMYGSSMPYASESIIGYECMQCKELQDANQNADGDNADQDNVREICETVYQQSGKCESRVSGPYYPNSAACDFIEGIKIIRQDGKIETSSSRASTTASVFIVLFAIAFFLLGGYVYYLKTKLDRAKINLSSE